MMKLKVYTVLVCCAIVIFSLSNKTNAQAPGWLWAKSVGGTGNETCRGVATDASGNVYTIGSYEGTADFDPGPATYNLTAAGILDIFILKLDTNGNFVWAKSIGNADSDVGYAITADNDGNFFVTGRYKNTVDFDPDTSVSTLTSVGDFDVFVAKYTTSGSFVWAKSMGGPGDDQGFSVTLDIFGNVYTTGYFSGTADFNPGTGVSNLISNGGYDVFVCKFSDNGNFLWANSVGSTLFDSGADITIDGLGNVYLTGNFNGTVDFNPGTPTYNLTSAGINDIFVLRLSASGVFIRAYAMGGTQQDLGNALVANTGGDIYTTGNYRGTSDFNSGPAINNLTSAGDFDIFISKFNDIGSYGWARSVGATQVDYGNDIAIDKYGDIYITGFYRGAVDFNPGSSNFTITSAGFNDAYILKLDSSGSFIWAKSVGSGQSEIGFALAFDSLNNVIICGHFMSPSVSFGTNVVTNTVGGGATSDFFVAKLDSGVNTTGLNNFLDAANIGVYPNPANDYLTVSFSNSNHENVLITLNDVTGKQVYSKEVIDDKTIIQTKNLVSGIYFVQIKTDSYVHTIKAVINN